MHCHQVIGSACLPPLLQLELSLYYPQTCCSDYLRHLVGTLRPLETGATQGWDLGVSLSALSANFSALCCLVEIASLRFLIAI